MKTNVLTEEAIRTLVQRELDPTVPGPPVSLGGGLSEGLQYHVEMSLPLRETIFRFGSDAHLEMIREARSLWRRGHLSVDSDDRFILETSLGEWGEYQGRMVPLDLPFEHWEDPVPGPVTEAEYKGRKVELNKPMRGGGKAKFSVYVKNDKGNVVKVGFGQPGVKIKTHSPARVKSFLARHNCDTPGPRWKARWWACNIHRYKKQLGLKFKGRW
jgi:hypothetical protein